MGAISSNKGVCNMLVLTRKPREEIRIGNGITITILRVKGQSVRIGIDAPNDIRIVRGELKPEDAAANEPAPAASTAEESPVTANAETRDSRSAAVRNRCEQSPRVRPAKPAPTACSSRLSSPRRANSSLQAMVARNRATNVVPAPASPTGNGPPR